MKFAKDEIIFLLGAGASVDAGIPASYKMVEELEKKLVNDKEKDWKKFKSLYYLVKSGVEFSYGVQGKDPIFNIEVLVNILNELEKKELHPLYPFIGSWGIRFTEVVENNFEIISEFRNKIVEQLKKWVIPKDLTSSIYFKCFEKFKKEEIQFPIRIFTLNYDKLIEENLKDLLSIERGFDPETREWNYKLFSPIEEEPDLYLYKLHGSIDWEREKHTQIVKETDNIPNEPELIFGVQSKVQYVDPYLFLFSEFRHYSLQAKLIVAIGYSFSDEHINGIISQALLNNKEAKLYVVTYSTDNKQKIEQDIYRKLECKNCNKNQIIINKKQAKDFFEKDLRMEKFEKLFKEKNNNDIL